MLLKEHPTTILGYEVETDFRFWMGVGVTLDSDKLTMTEKMDAVLRAVFGKSPYDIQEAAEWFEAVAHFYSCGAEDRGITPPNEQIIDWAYDSDTVWADFYGQYYGMDLDNEKMHWWRFKALFDSLPPDSAIKNRIGIRGEDLSDYTGKGQEKFYRRKEEQKRAVAIRWTEEVDY